MSTSLTIPDLLRQIEADKVDADIVARCQEAERLCRQRDFDNALEAIQLAVDLAARSGVALNTGVTFLYLAAIRYATPRKGAQDQAARDAETAVHWLKRDTHHAAIAHLICAVILSEQGQTRAALRHYREAQTLVGQLITYWHRRNKPDQKEYYQDLQNNIVAAITDLQPKPVASTESIAEDRSAVGTSSISGGGEESTPSGPPTLQLEYQNKSDQFTLNYYEISRVWINGQEYLVETINPIDPQQPGLRLLPDQRYIAVPDPDSDQPQQYVLVKEGGQPTQGQIVVNVDPVRLRSWTDQDESTKDPHILGTVAARLRLAISPEPAPEPEMEIDEDLLDCMDAFAAAYGAKRYTPKDLEAIRSKFLTYVRKQYDLELMSITPGETLFDPNLHNGVVTTRNTRLPDDVIVKVLSDGYTRQGKIVRVAQVVVNRLKAKR